MSIVDPVTTKAAIAPTQPCSFEERKGYSVRVFSSNLTSLG